MALEAMAQKFRQIIYSIPSVNFLHMARLVSDFLVDRLHQWGITHIFGSPFGIDKTSSYDTVIIGKQFKDMH